VAELVKEFDEPKKKKIRKNMTLADRREHFLQKSVVRSKVVKVSYFHEQGHGVFLEKLDAQCWLASFTNIRRGCSVPDLAEFYMNCVVTSGVVTRTLNGYELRFDASDLGELLGVSSEGFDVYVHKDKSILSDERLLELTQTLSQKPHLTESWPMRKGKMMPLHQLLFWFVIENIVPRGHGHKLADPMDMCYTNLLDRGEKINLPAIMISHIRRIANTSKDHDMRYGFLLTSVFEKFGISLQKRVGFQVSDEIESSTLIGCGFKVIKRSSAGLEQGP